MMCIGCGSRFKMEQTRSDGQSVVFTPAYLASDEYFTTDDKTTNRIFKDASSSGGGSNKGIHKAITIILDGAQKYWTRAYSTEKSLDERTEDAKTKGGPYWHEAGFNKSWEYAADRTKWRGHLRGPDDVAEHIRHCISDPRDKRWVAGQEKEIPFWRTVYGEVIRLFGEIGPGAPPDRQRFITPR